MRQVTTGRRLLISSGALIWLGARRRASIVKRTLPLKGNTGHTAWIISTATRQLEMVYKGANDQWVHTQLWLKLRTNPTSRDMASKGNRPTPSWVVRLP